MRLQSGNQDKRKKKNNGGFTTIEQIVVIILVLILASALVIGIMKWIQWTNFKRQNEYARTLFVAAQNQLTERSENNTLAELKKDVAGSLEFEEDAEGDLTADRVKLLGKNGNPYDLDEVWPQSKEKEKKGDYRAAIYSVTGTADDYKNYAKGTLDDKQIVAMYDLLSPYVYDSSIFSNGTVCVEFAPEDGQVFAVLYSDKADEFVYGSGKEDQPDKVDISNRKTDYRKSRMVGYYGVDMLSKATSTKAVKPSITNVRLHNEDTLNLTFRLGEKFETAIRELTYNITVYNKDEDVKKARKVLELTLDGTQLKSQLETSKAGTPIACKVQRYNYDENGKAELQDLGDDYQVMAWIEKGQVTVVLDGADLEATSYRYQDVYDELMDTKRTGDKLITTEMRALKETYSFRRFGVITEDIYCMVSGSGKNYKPTAKKKSNTENTYFDAVKSITENEGTKDEVLSTTYTIKNARHLYNIRYLEDYGDTLYNTADSGKKAVKAAKTPEKITYQIAKDVDWKAFVKGGSLFNSQQIVEEKDSVFPSISQLRETSVFTGSDKKSYTISGLTITEEANRASNLHKGEDGNELTEDEQATGLFVTNEGTIKDFKLDQITVTGGYKGKDGREAGGNKVGAFCGINKGELSNLETASSYTENSTDMSKSTVTGRENVGGIFGYDGKTGNVDITGLVNRAQVSGTKNVGGIVGTLSGSDSHKVTVQKCSNYGAVAAFRDGAENIGGIVGSIESQGEKNAVITECTSSPQYTGKELEKALSEGCIGKNVGGIAGYNSKGQIIDCNTQKEGRNKEGYVIGGSHVGGIVGYNTEDAYIITSGKTNGINAAHVIGNEYAGGIVGENNNSSDKHTISNWTNKGIVAAKSKYAGGIVGYNAKGSKISNCSSNVDNNQAAKDLAKREDLFGDYAGGIVGYNAGNISSDSLASITCYVLGNNFIGGIVGYNDTSGIINNYAVSGGYVRASGSYVGGFAGVNTAPALLNQSLKCNPNEVTGSYCVGGMIGANIVSLKTKVLADFYTDNFLGTLNAEAFAGGFIGYNKHISDVSKTRGTLENTVEDLKSAKNSGNLYDATARIAQLDSGLGMSTGGSLVVTGEVIDSNPGPTQSRFGGIKARIYVGGVIGYNAEGSQLTIQNVKNMTPVTATDAIVNEKEQPGQRAYDNTEFKYSYAGGIIGKVSRDVQIYNCHNQDAGDITTKGTYLGSICEINEWVVQECSASSIGTSGHDYVGGIVGLNKSEGRLINCKLNGKTVTGRNNVGGMAAENYGMIGGTYISMSKIRAYGSHEAGAAGGVAACNYGEIIIDYDYEHVNSDMYTAVKIEADGPNVGGLIGKNAGKIENKLSGVTISGESSVTGQKNVGGIIGRNESGDISGFYNTASVTAGNGNAGGIVGESMKDTTILNCTNTGAVQAQKSGNAGGIIGNNTGKVTGCKNHGNVAAQNGICGGMAGENAAGAEIQSCEVSGKNEIDALLTFEGKEKAGGISGINNGTIAASSVKNLRIMNLADSRNSVLGGITGDNKGTIENCRVGSEPSYVVLRSSAADVSAGGVAGINSGTISGAVINKEEKQTYTRVYANLSFVRTDQAYYGNMGGVAGINKGMIQGYEYNGTVAGTGNNPQNTPQYDPNLDYEANGSVIYGYGGIAGVNGDSGKASKGASITNCKVNLASITGLGDANNIANVGGVAGVNGIGAVISEIDFGVEKKYNVKNFTSDTNISSTKASVYVGDGAEEAKDSYTHAGGVAGLNSGSISDIGFNNDKDNPSYSKEIDNTYLIVEGYRGHCGGIVGYNRRTGMVSQVSTGNKWVVYAPNNAQDNGCGGIIGYSASEKDISYCYNRAIVRKLVENSNGVGGIIGRLECATSSDWVISHCENYGGVTGKDRVGGIVGVWKYYGGTISDCKNYAKIKGGPNGNGGIAGQIYRVETTPARFIRCENHGTIEGNVSAGIAGGFNGTVKLQLQRCTNTGLIKGAGTNGGGLVGKLENPGSNSYITGCNNYGYQYVPKSDKTGQSNLNGIIAQSSSTNIKISGCIGAADTVNPLMNDKDEKGNYYIDNNPDEKDYAGIKTSAQRITSTEYHLESEKDVIGLPGFKIDPKIMHDNSSKTYDENLTVMGSDDNNIRYKTFAADNPYFIASAAGEIKSLDKPDTAAFTSGKGSYEAKWKPVENATFYEYTITYLDADGKELGSREGTIYDTNITFPVTAINGTAVKAVSLEVTAGAETTIKNGNSYEYKIVRSETTASHLSNIGAILPIPQYHMELVRIVQNKEDKLVYKAYLDNKKEYEEFVTAMGAQSETDVNEALSKIKIHIGIGQGDIYTPFTAAAACSDDMKYYEGTDDNKTFYAYASSDNSVSSPQVMRESMAFKSGTYISGNNIANVYMVPKTTNQVGFQGTTADTLSYRLTMEPVDKSENAKILYMRSELMADDVTLGIPVAVSTSQLRVSNVTKDAIPTHLGALPANLLDEHAYKNLMVRSYPLMMSNNIAYTGHTVGLASVKTEEEQGSIGVSKETLAELFVTKDHQVTRKIQDPDTKLIKNVKTEDGKMKKVLASGFVVELASDGSYTLYYNALLEYNTEVAKYEYNEGIDNSSQKTQVFYYWLQNYLNSKEKQPQPVIHVNEKDGGDGNPNEDRMIITWDLAKPGYERIGTESSDGQYNYKEGAVYDYVITGYTADNTAVQIEADTYTTGESDTGKSGENRLELDTRTWNYKKVVISISRQGQEKNEMTEIFPAGAIKEVDLKLRFSQITRPDTALHKDADGYVQKNSLLYDVSWHDIPEKEQKDKAGYEILVACAGDNPEGTKEYSGKDGEQKFNETLNKEQKLYAAKPGVTIEDKSSDGKITYTWAADYKGLHVVKEMELSWTEDLNAARWTITKKLTEIWKVPADQTRPAEDSTEESKKLMTTLDLNDFGRGYKIEVSVRALAKEDTQEYTTQYRDGIPGVVRDITLPSRLGVPDVTNLKSSPQYHTPEDADLGDDSKAYMTLEEYNRDGINLTIALQNPEDAVSGKYELAAAVYDEKPENAESDTGKVIYDGDGDNSQEGYWNTGAVATLIGKESSEMMDGENLGNASYSLKPGDIAYAGKWLKVAMRSISENNISSVWSDEDEEQENTVNYQWIRIPRVQLTVPQLVPDKKDMFYSEEGDWMGDPSQETEDGPQYRLEQETLSFDMSDRVGSYRIQLIRNSKTGLIEDSGGYKVYDADWLYLEGAGDGSYAVFYAASEQQTKTALKQQAEQLTDKTKKSSIDEAAVYIGTIAQKDGYTDYIRLPYSESIATGPAEAAPKITVASYIQMVDSVDGIPGFQIVLPDTDNFNNKNYPFTSQLSVQARGVRDNPAAEEDKDYSAWHEDSEVCNWYREFNDDKSTNIITMPGYQKVPVDAYINIGSLKLEKKDGIDYYKITGSAGYWLVYQIEFSDGINTYREYASVNAQGQYGSILTTVSLLPAEEYQIYAGMQMKVRAAAVIMGRETVTVTEGGLSQWTDWVSMGTVPAVKRESAVEKSSVESQDNEVNTQPIQPETKDGDVDTKDIQQNGSPDINSGKEGTGEDIPQDADAQKDNAGSNSP